MYLVIKSAQLLLATLLQIRLGLIGATRLQLVHLEAQQPDVAVGRDQIQVVASALEQQPLDALAVLPLHAHLLGRELVPLLALQGWVVAI